MFIVGLRVGFGQLRSEFVDECLLRVGWVKLLVLFPRLGLSRFDALQAIFGVKSRFAIALGRFAKLSTTRDHLVDDVLLKSSFFVVSVHEVIK